MLFLDEETRHFIEIYPEVDPPDLVDFSFCFPSSTGCITGRNFPSDGCSTIPMGSQDRKHYPAEKNERGMREHLKFRCDQTIGPLNDGNGLSERDMFCSLHKSSSDKVKMHVSPCGIEIDYCKAGVKSQFSTFRRMLDPFRKSKCLHSSPVSREEEGCGTAIGSEFTHRNRIFHKSLSNNFSNTQRNKTFLKSLSNDFSNTQRNRTFHKSLSNDFSDTAYNTEFSARSVKKDQHSSVMLSPVHLQGHLSLELKHGVPYFEFSLEDTEDVLSSKTWRTNNAYNWVYTFHSMNNKRTSNSSGWGTRERLKESLMVGQMQVSCFFLSEMIHSGAVNNSMVTEFVLYDIMHARRALADSVYSMKPMKDATGENLVRGPPFESNEFSYGLENNKLCTGDDPDSDGFDASTPYPWAPVDLHPNLEIATVVIQVPFERREGFKEKQGDKLGSKENLNLSDVPAATNQKITEDSTKNISCVKVVIPVGTHGLPSEPGSDGPSPLLDRWRSGGRCDCGGWDMACPLVVFDNEVGVLNMEDQPCRDNQQCTELFFQGGKEKAPALTITFISEGRYCVDFHARLSKLQVFSICVAILHGAKASTAVAQMESWKKLPCNAVKVLLDEEVKLLIEAVADKEKETDSTKIVSIARA